MSQMNSVCTLTSYFLTIHFNIIIPSTPKTITQYPGTITSSFTSPGYMEVTRSFWAIRFASVHQRHSLWNQWGFLYMHTGTLDGAHVLCLTCDCMTLTTAFMNHLCLVVTAGKFYIWKIYLCSCRCTGNCESLCITVSVVLYGHETRSFTSREEYRWCLWTGCWGEYLHVVVSK
jgi:hypothetical protein